MNELLIYVLDFCRSNGIISSVLCTLVIMGVMAAIAHAAYKHKILPFLETYLEKKEQDKEYEEEFRKHTQDIELLKQEYEEIKKNTKTANDKLNVLSMMLQDMQSREDAKERARLKSSISRLYRECHATKQWTKMQKDTMEDMIASYESCNGQNSFVHETVQKEMYTWDIVDD